MRDAGHRTPDAGHRTSDGEKSKNNISTPQGGGHNNVSMVVIFADLVNNILSETLIYITLNWNKVINDKLYIYSTQDMRKWLE